MVIGVTGGIASGKSTVCKILASKGFVHIDADDVAHDVLDLPDVIGRIAEIFGNDVLYVPEDQRGPLKVDRKALGRIVFADHEKMDILEKITHPEVARLIREQVASDPDKDYVIEAIALVSSGIIEICDELWVVYVEPEQQIKRLMESRNLSYEEALDRLKSQEDHDWNEQNTSRIIYSTEPLETMTHQVEEALNQCYH